MKFRLIKGDIDEFAIFEESLPTNLDNLTIDNKISVKINVEDKKIALVNTVKYIDGDKSLLKITSILFFQIDENSWKDSIVDNQIIVSKESIQKMGSITAGATRGMLIAKCLNTPFSQLILPPVNISKMIGEDLKFTLSSKKPEQA